MSPELPAGGPLRDRLLMNRDGRLHPDQWRELVSEPLAPLLLLLVPAILILRGYLLTLFVGAFWFVGLAGLAALGVMLALRARRYARLPVQTAVLRCTQPPHPWQWWKGMVFQDEGGKAYPFSRSMAPDFRPQPQAVYLVYYLEDGERRILLSAAPADSPGAEELRPTPLFYARLKRRGP